MKTIWKYKLQVMRFQTLVLPKGATILSVQNQIECLWLWALVDPDAEKTEDRQIEILGTGHQAGDLPRAFVGTVLMESGQLVLHVFERTSDPAPVVRGEPT